MKTKFTSLLTLLMLALTFQVSGQEKQFNGLLNIAAVSTGGSSDYTITTVYSDESGTYSDTDVAVGDIVWDRTCKTYKVEAITQTGIPLILEVSDINGAGEPTAGLGVIFRQTTNKNYPLSVAGAPATLSACIQSHLSITLDKDINTLEGSPGGGSQTLLNGTSDPVNSTGNDGDFYINTATNTLFGPKTSGSWPSGTSIKGDKGDTGDQGPAGTGVTIVGSVANAAALPNPYGGNTGDMYITQDNGHGHVYNGTSFDDVGQIQGPKGDTGATGSAGAKGDKGDTGDTGAAGAKGDTGATGAAGANGTDGTDGKTILNGTTDPATSTGADGDFYINTTTNTLFGPKTGGTNWGAGTSLKGDKGDTGDTGATGSAGAKGDKGDTGDQGPAGTGVTIVGSVANAAALPNPYGGNTGDMFITQDDGHGHVYNGTSFDDVGQIQGPKGDTGATGSAGAKGDKGDTGDTGATGATGAAGANGTDGTDGKTILNGTTDPAGGTGADGDFYINTTTNTLFGPKTGGTNWGAGTSLVGPKGDQGDPGADGGSILIYDAGNGAVVRASATGITFSITNSVGTLVVPDGTRLFSVSITGNSTADITVGSDFSVVLDYANGNDMNATDFSNFFAPTVSIINAATQPFGGPTDALSFTYDTALQRRITGLSNGDLTIKIVNLGSTYTDWSVTITF